MKKKRERASLFIRTIQSSYFKLSIISKIISRIWHLKEINDYITGEKKTEDKKFYCSNENSIVLK